MKFSGSAHLKNFDNSDEQFVPFVKMHKSTKNKAGEQDKAKPWKKVQHQRVKSRYEGV